MTSIDEVVVFCRALSVVSQDVAGHPWRRGTVCTADPCGLISDWLDECDRVYLRRSSHLTAPDRRVFPPRGIDLPAGWFAGGDPRYARGLRTLLYQPYVRMGERRLLLKLESAGARLLTVPQTENALPSRPLKWTDLPDTTHHVASALASLRRGNDVRRGEKSKFLPSSARTATLEVVRQLLPASLSRECSCGVVPLGPAFPEVHRVLHAYETMSRCGRHRLDHIDIDSWRANLPLHPDDPEADLRVRLGNEVVLLPPDLVGWVAPRLLPAHEARGAQVRKWGGRTGPTTVTAGRSSPTTVARHG